MFSSLIKSIVPLPLFEISWREEVNMQPGYKVLRTVRFVGCFITSFADQTALNG